VCKLWGFRSGTNLASFRFHWVWVRQMCKNCTTAVDWWLTRHTTNNNWFKPGLESCNFGWATDEDDYNNWRHNNLVGGVAVKAAWPKMLVLTLDQFFSLSLFLSLSLSLAVSLLFWGNRQSGCWTYLIMLQVILVESNLSSLARNWEVTVVIVFGWYRHTDRPIFHN